MLFVLVTQAQNPPQRFCRKLEIPGEATQGLEWRATIGRSKPGEDWLIRLVPVASTSSSSPISGWDLVVNPAADQDYPDALLLATPPYSSLNPREISTSYRMRAQDAIAWSPRHFHFLTSTADLRRAREAYKALRDTASSPTAREQASEQLLRLSASGPALAAGKIEILDAHLVPGTADPAPFAAQWAASYVRIPHTLDHTSASPTPIGTLRSIRFKLTFWLPGSWKAASNEGIAPVKCAE